MTGPLVVIPVGPHDEDRLKSLLSLLTLCEPAPVEVVRLDGERDRGYPDGAWDLFQKAVRSARTQRVEDVAILEPDGAPLVRDWYAQLCREHGQTLAAGKWITCGMADHPWPHANGNLILTARTWLEMDLPRPPSGEAWDVRYAERLLPGARVTTAIYRRYRATWKAEDVRRAIASGGVWAHSSRDGSLHEQARKVLSS